MKKVRSILAMVLVVVMSFAMVISVSAMDAVTEETMLVSGVVADAGAPKNVEGDDEGIMPLVTNYVWVGNDYTTIASNPNGINGNLYIWVTHTLSTPNSLGYNGWNRGMDILMFDKTGNVVWRGDDVFGVSSSGKLWCGDNVTRVDMRIGAKIGVNEDWYEVEVTY